ncbi:Piezo-type mechanosensitive ion channel component 2 [Dissostichus eleginoides]|uniref:Piezo-type mechanosensitive ion channel component 2 n=1 Tax=Dissostichus eleginoides TaxID=100907 RepID=A0AAD9BNN9_DISEL|nr:Piezo-type mechanosensitive ion channel component 2 [Dissostichus eleginoides]
MRFCWVLLSALLDSLTAWLRGLCQEHIDISTVLRIEHCMLTQQAKQGNVPTRDAIHVYYQRQILKASRESGLNYSSHEAEGQTSAERGPEEVSPPDTNEEEPGPGGEGPEPGLGGECPEPGPGGDGPEPGPGGEGPEPGPGGDGPEPGPAGEGPEPGPGGDGPEPGPGGDGPCSGAEPETEEDTAVEVQYEDCPECLLIRTRRPRLSRMERVRSSSSSSSSDQDRMSPAHSFEEPKPPSPSSLFLPPSYSLALGLDLQEGEGFGERSDFLSDSTSCPAASRAQDLTASDLLRSRTFYDEQLEASDRFYADQHQLLQICYALYNILAARSETVCFLVIVLNHMVSASCLTLVLPVLVFLWATLSVPRPSKTFWMTAIIYTEVTIVIKYFFQFGFFPFNKKLELLVLFYHRAILKCHGLWDQTVTTETETLHPSVSQLDSGSVSIDPSDPVLRRRVRRRTRSSSTQLRSPAGSLSSRVLQPSRVDLLLEKLRELSIRAKRHSVSRCMSLYLPVLQFFRALVQPEYSAVTDVYVLMFLCDTVDFIVIVFGFWAFGVRFVPHLYLSE